MYVYIYISTAEHIRTTSFDNTQITNMSCYFKTGEANKLFLLFVSSVTVAPRCVAVCCNVLQCVAVWCSVVLCVAACCNVLQCGTERCSVLQFVWLLLFVSPRCVTVCHSVLQ